MCIGLPDVFCWRLLECWFQCRRLIRDACSDKLFPGDFYLSCFMAIVFWCILNLALINIYFRYVILLTGTNLDFWKTVGWSLCHQGRSQGGWKGAIFWVRILLCLTHFEWGDWNSMVVLTWPSSKLFKMNALPSSGFSLHFTPLGVCPTVRFSRFA